MSDLVFSATGRRKESTARVIMKVGGGVLTINNKGPIEYLKRGVLVDIINQPMNETDTIGKLDITCRVTGGGLTGQAGAIRLAISRALAKLDPDLRPALRHKGYLTRDARVVERKKYGQPKARKRFQYSKR
ncbi:MAG: 30S ribosomal protein S9 [Candidatus Zixiibacteriota bacterium]|nr:MAG: 30S ribosomal protein S9 [candidate division Zixibacteria bacterium]HDL04703.1 30S ribosomal protein S9 [candidate division Zixibacteria bacterium]